MKKLYFISALILLMLLGQAFTLFAQAPEGFTYQAEARDGSGKLLASKALTVETTILKGSSSGSIEWKKDYNVTTDNYGLFTIVVGELDGIPPLTGVFSAIEWGSGTYFLNVKILWAKKWLDTGTTQLLSVPYALYAKSAGSANLTETDPIFTSSQAANISGADITKLNNLSGTNTGDQDLSGKVDKVEGKGLSSEDYTTADKTKLESLQPGWSLTGNAGTSTSTNFVGTTDNNPLIFKVNNQVSGRIDPNSHNLSYGVQSFLSNTIGNYNTAFGGQSLYSNTTGMYNTANGYQALNKNATGYQNTANGYWALCTNIEGHNNTAIGAGALYYTTGTGNTALGSEALIFNTTGDYNTAVGYRADMTGGPWSNVTILGYDTKATDNNQVVLGNTSVENTVLHGNVLHYGATSGYVGLKAPSTVTNPYTLTLPATSPASNGQVLSSTTGGILSWTTPTLGTVTSITGTGSIVSSGGTTPAISINPATTSAAGSMSAADKTKLEGIAEGAEVNVNADWNATEGDAQILNKPAILSGTQAGQMQYWNGTAWVTVASGLNGQILKYKNGVPTWSDGNIEDLVIGEAYQGGIIAYILQSGDPGYIAGEIHGLIAAPSDQGRVDWGCMMHWTSGADGTALGTGNQNTIDIVADCTTEGIAAKLCSDLVLNGFSDWYLPSKDELNKLYLNSAAIGGFNNNFYWSSSEFTGEQAWSQRIGDGSQSNHNKIFMWNVRAIRSF